MYAKENCYTLVGITPRVMKSGGGGAVLWRERDLGKGISGCIRKKNVTHRLGSHRAMKSRGEGCWYHGVRGTCCPSER